MLRVGIVGTGGMGTVHLNNYAKIADCKVVALVGFTEQSKATSAQWSLPLYPDVASMIQNEQLDILDVCTPTFLHKQHVMEGLSANLDCITEKPIALNLKDAEEMYALAEKMGKNIYVAQVLQFSKEVEILRELIRSEKFGKPLDAVFERLSGAPGWVSDGWLFDRSKSGLLPFDLHIHDLDMIISFFGKPKTASFTSCGGQTKTYKEHYRFQYNYEELNVAAEAAWFNASFPFTARWRVYFENVVVVYDGKSLTAYFKDAPAQIFNIQEDILIPTGINLPPTGMFYRELEHFLSCIKLGRPSTLVSKEQILNVIELLDQISKE